MGEKEGPIPFGSGSWVFQVHGIEIIIYPPA
jgi:hypothetical protein